MNLYSEYFFDTIVIKVDDVMLYTKKQKVRTLISDIIQNNLIGISLDETTTYSDVLDILSLL